VLAEFPSVAEALSCALAIQLAISKENEHLFSERQMRFKNIDEPVRVFRVAAIGEAPIYAAPSVDVLTAPSLPDKPSVAVLPFANLSSDPEQEFFADGIAEDIITALSRYPRSSSSREIRASRTKAAPST
jgi:adenylate cyclase